MSTNESVVIGDKTATTDKMVTTNDLGSSDAIHPDLPKVEEDTLAQASLEGESSSTKDTVEEDVSSVDRIKPAYEETELEAVLEVDHVTDSKFSAEILVSTNVNESNQANDSDQGYESGKLGDSDKGDGSNQVNEDTLESPFSTPKEVSVLAKNEDSVPSTDSELGICFPILVAEHIY